MSNVFKLLPFTIAIFILVGCATIPVLKEPIKKEKSYNMPFDKIWPEIVTIVTEGGNIIKVADKSSGVIAFDRSLNKTELKDFVLQKPSGMSYYGQGAAHITLRLKVVDKDTTNIKIISHIDGMLYSWTGSPTYGPPHKLSSNGKLEEDVFKLLDTQLGAKEYKWME